jgi:hypothetical protein
VHNVPASLRQGARSVHLDGRAEQGNRAKKFVTKG